MLLPSYSKPRSVDGTQLVRRFVFGAWNLASMRMLLTADLPLRNQDQSRGSSSNKVFLGQVQVRRIRATIALCQGILLKLAKGYFEKTHNSMLDQVKTRSSQALCIPASLFYGRREPAVTFLPQSYFFKRRGSSQREHGDQLQSTTKRSTIDDWGDDRYREMNKRRLKTG